MMDFTYNGYERMLAAIAGAGYVFCSYFDYQKHAKACILRHDVDFDLEKAVAFARRETQMLLGKPATYFVLLNTEFYNLFALENRRRLDELQKLGCRIGLHFDAPVGTPADGRLVEQIMEEIYLLGKIAGQKIDAVSFHRPYAELLKANLEIPQIVNTYSNVFFRDFKYYSDSRMRWKEDILADVQNARFDRLQVLVHPFWYEAGQESMQDKLARFIHQAKKQRYDLLDDNFTDLSSVIEKTNLA